MSGYAQRAAERRQNQGLKFPAGDYKFLMKGFAVEYGKKPPKNKMITLELGIDEGPAEHKEIIDKLIEKNRRFKHRFVFSENGFGFDDFLLFLEDLGADLSKVRSESEDPEHADLIAVLRQTDRRPPTLEGTIEWKEGSQFPNFKMRKVERVFNASAASTTAAPAPAPAPVTEIVYYMDGPNVGSATRADVQAKIDAGYVGQVNVNNTGWVSAEAAGFKVPAPRVAEPEVIPAQVTAAPAETVPAPAAKAAPIKPPAPESAALGTAPGAPVDPFAVS